MTRLIDGFVEDGDVRLHGATSPGRSPGWRSSSLALHAPAEDLEEVNDLRDDGVAAHLPEARACLLELVLPGSPTSSSTRRAEGPRGDVVDAVLDAEIDGRPITRDEIIGMPPAAPPRRPRHHRRGARRDDDPLLPRAGDPRAAARRGPS